jgi:hypothetical protein
VTDLRPPVAVAHDYIPRPRAHWTTASVDLRGHTGPLHISQPPIWATVAAAVLAGRHDPRMEPLARRRLRPVVVGQLLQHHDAPPAPYLDPGGGLQRDTAHHSVSW